MATDIGGLSTMLDIGSQYAVLQPKGLPRYLSARVALAFLVVVLTLFVFVATLLTVRAGGSPMTRLLITERL
jgi:hypothetical protein